jgi:hypothetical protein
MNEHTLTRLVVGEPFNVCMGIPVTQTSKIADVSKTIYWEDGKWGQDPPLMDRINKLRSGVNPILAMEVNTKATPHQKTDQITISRSTMAIALATLLVVSITVGGIAGNRYRTAVDPAKDALLPIASADKRLAENGGKSPVQVIATVDEAYPLPNDIPRVVPNESQRTATVQSPAVSPVIAPKTVQQAIPAVTPSEPLPPALVTRAKEKEKQPKPKDQGAIILDAEVLELRDSPKPAPTVAPIEAPRPAIKALLVAVSPDGKFALFTNAATRLPEKFAVGDKLTNGDVVRSIDYAAGSVKTDLREYRLE